MGRSIISLFDVDSTLADHEGASPRALESVKDSLAEFSSIGMEDLKAL